MRFSAFSIALVLSAGLAGSSFAQEKLAAQNPVSKDTFLKYYGLDLLQKEGWTGKNQHIAILNGSKYGDWEKASIQEFFKETGIHPTVNYIDLNPPPMDIDTQLPEIVLDVEMAALVAPEATIDVYSTAIIGTSDDDETADSFANAIQAVIDRGAHIISISYNHCELAQLKQNPADLKALDDLLEQTVQSQHVTIFAASGDAGTGCEETDSDPLHGLGVRSWPATSPFITAVGMNSLSPETSDGSFDELGTYNSGGGESAMYPLPSWQEGIVPSSYKHRGIPDVSWLGGHPGVQAFGVDKNGKSFSQPGMGTSVSTPLWAGYIALVDQARDQMREAPIGYLNPLLYRLRTDLDVSPIKDIVKSDAFASQPGAQEPTIGWDADTGLGSPNPRKLFSCLVDPFSNCYRPR